MKFDRTMRLWQKGVAIGVGLVGAIFLIRAVSSGNWRVTTIVLALTAVFVAISLTMKQGNTP